MVKPLAYKEGLLKLSKQHDIEYTQFEVMEMDLIIMQIYMDVLISLVIGGGKFNQECLHKILQKKIISLRH